MYYEICQWNKQGQIVRRWRFHNRGEAARFYDAVKLHHSTWRIKLMECRALQVR